MSATAVVVLGLATVPAMLGWRWLRTPAAAPATVPASEPRSPARTASALPAHRVIDPKREKVSEGTVWQLRADPKCGTRRFHGRRYATVDSIALHILGCDIGSCTCCYKPVRDSRAAERREGNDRRDTLRFEMRNDRRVGRNRRRHEGWSETNYLA